MDALKTLFERHFRSPAEGVQRLQGQLGGSGRRIIRLTGAGHSAIGILYDVREENVAFLEFSRHFRRHGLPVPEIYGEDLDRGAYLEEDLGDIALYEFLSKSRRGGEVAPGVVEAYRKVVEALPRFQVEAGGDLNYKVCYPRDSFDRQSIAWDLNYFKYYFLRLAGVPFSEQALGAYGFRGLYERKTHFLQSVPYALKNVRWLLHNVELPIKTPMLMECFERMLSSRLLESVVPEGAGLTVRVFSFSFHQGLPKDDTGHGGGFVFDVRSVPNPGREERFKQLTGRDQPVIDYLDAQESAHKFFGNAASLVDASVSDYRRRGFKSLMVSFGCTGGQHPSVYMAEQMAGHLRAAGEVEVVLRHLGLENQGLESGQ